MDSGRNLGDMSSGTKPVRSKGKGKHKCPRCEKMIPLYKRDCGCIKKDRSISPSQYSSQNTQ